MAYSFPGQGSRLVATQLRLTVARPELGRVALTNARRSALAYSLRTIPLLYAPVDLCAGRASLSRGRPASDRATQAMTGISSIGTSLIE